MSKFIDKLEKVGQHTPSQLGFGPASRREAPTPQIMLIGQVSLEKLVQDPSLSEARVDAILLSLGDSDAALDGVAESLKAKIWGVRVGAISDEQAARLKEKGCDFVVFEAENTAAAVLNDEDLGKVIAITADLDEEMAHAIHELSIDAAFFAPEMELLPLTVQKLIDVQIVRGLVGKCFVMTAPAELAQPELEAFRNSDISGLVVELTSPDAIARTSEAIAKLPRHRPKKPKGDLIAQAPYGFQPPSQHVEEEDEDDDI